VPRVIHPLVDANLHSQYNYLFGAAVDGGAQIFVFVFSFSVGGAGETSTAFPNWALNPVGNPDYCMDTRCVHGGPGC
jgi:hypothetical protein